MQHAPHLLINHQLLLFVYELLPRLDASLDQEPKCVKKYFLRCGILRLRNLLVHQEVNVIASVGTGVDLEELTNDEIVSVDEHGPFHLAGTDGTSVKDRYMKIVLRPVLSFQSRACFSKLTLRADQTVKARIQLENFVSPIQSLLLMCNF